MKSITLEYRRNRMYRWMRLATKLHNGKMGINANDPYTLRIKQIATKALKYYKDALPVREIKKKKQKNITKS